MGKIVRFRRRRWVRLGDYGAPEPKLRFWPEQRRRTPLRRLAFAARPFVLLGILCIVYAGLDPALVEPPNFLSADPEHVSENFTRCGPGRGHACVIDGDTFKLGGRSVRIRNWYSPQVKAVLYFRTFGHQPEE